jgi:hypothetical protein
VERQHEGGLVATRLAKKVVLQGIGDALGKGSLRVAGIAAGEIVAVGPGDAVAVEIAVDGAAGDADDPALERGWIESV